MDKNNLGKGTEKNAPRAGKRRKSMLLLLLPLLASFLVYSNSFHNTFLYGDDENIITRNRYLDDWKYLPEVFRGNLMDGAGATCNFYRPLQTTLYMAITGIEGRGQVWPYHLANTALHGLTGTLFAWLLYAFIPQLGIVPAAAGALVWTLHPIHVEEVAQPSGTQSSMYSFFVMAVLCLLLVGLRRRETEGRPGLAPAAGWLLAANFCLLLGLFSKESAVVAAPLALLLHAAWLRSRGLRSNWGQLGKTHLPLWIITCVYIILRLTVLNFGGTLNFYGSANIFTEHFIYRVYTLLSVLGEGVRIFFYPAGLHPERNWPLFTNFLAHKVWIPAAALVLTAFWALRSWRLRVTLPALALVFFLISYAPMSNLAAQINALMWEHWFYLPSMSFIILLAAAVKGGKTRNAFAITALCAAAALAPATYKRNRNWSDPETYSRFVLANEPSSAKTWNNLAMSLSERGDSTSAIEAYKRALALNDYYPQTHHNLANALTAAGRLQEAVEQYNKALDMDAKFHYSHLALAEIYYNTGNFGMALEHLFKVKEIFPELPGLDAIIEQTRDMSVRTRNTKPAKPSNQLLRKGGL